MHRRDFIGSIFAASAALGGMTGCGTFIHSERCHNPHSDRIDWRIAALDGLGLLLFFVPGVIAFVVDFSTGAIYLPIEPQCPTFPSADPIPSAAETGASPIPPRAPTEQPFTEPTLAAPANATSLAPQTNESTSQNLRLIRVSIPRDKLARPRIEQVVADHVGQPISLDDDQTRLSVLPSLDRYDEQTTRHRSDRTFGVALRSFFSRLTTA
jgi:hypothetical protein